MQYDQDRDKEAKLRLQEIMNKYPVKQVDVARVTGIHHSSLSLWLQGKIKGHQVKITETIENYLENFMSNKPRMNTVHISKLSLLKSPNNQIEFDKELLSSEQPIPVLGSFGHAPSSCQPNLQLIPIKLDLEFEGRRLKDIFLWDKNEPYQTLESFAKILMEEHNLPISFESEIISSMRKQVNQFRQYKQMDGELVKVVQLNVRIGNIVVRDQFEWDINNPNNSPEDFSESLCADLGLGSEFMLPIAHQIREQINEHQKLAHQERRGGYQHLSAHGRDFKGGKGEFDKNAPGKPLGEINDVKGHSILSAAEIEQMQVNYELQAFHNSGVFNPPKTMIRSMDELYQPQKEAVNKFFQPSPIDEPFHGWAPDIQILNEKDLKKIEKQEERQQRYRNRGQRR